MKHEEDTLAILNLLGLSIILFTASWLNTLYDILCAGIQCILKIMFILLSCWKWKERRKYKLSKLSTELAYTKCRNHHADLLKNIENTSSFGKHCILNFWITLHFNVQICSLAFCWNDQTIWRFVWDINALGRCSIIY